MFKVYFELGLQHIADINAYDHILFIVALCSIYQIKEWKKILILVTAFTIGHSITLALAVLDLIQFPREVIETLIPITIIITCLFNIFFFEKQSTNKVSFNYLLALFFGFIHGMGFSNFLRSVILPGEENSLITQLFAFNVGIELGQLLIVICILMVSFFALSILGIKQRYWNWLVSGITILIAINLLW